MSQISFNKLPIGYVPLRALEIIPPKTLFKSLRSNKYIYVEDADVSHVVGGIYTPSSHSQPYYCLRKTVNGNIVLGDL